MSDAAAIPAFIARWSDSGVAERAKQFTRARMDKVEELLQTMVTLGQARELSGGKYGT